MSEKTISSSTDQVENREPTTQVDEILDDSFPASDPPSWTLGGSEPERSDTEGNPPQHQSSQPGSEAKMTPAPKSLMKDYLAAGKLKGKVALVSGGDSGIGRAVCIGFAKEGADVAFIYLDEDEDAELTLQCIEAEGRKALALKGDIGDPDFCCDAVKKTLNSLGKLNIVVNNAAEQHICNSIEDIDNQQLKRTFETNVFGAVYLTQEAVSHLSSGDSIIFTTSVVAYRGKDVLLDYAATKGALLGLTRSLAANLVDRNIRVNAVAPGPIWTPLIPASFNEEQVKEFGMNSPMGRPGQPDEVAPSYIFLASNDASYITGQVIHPNGGTVIGA